MKKIFCALLAALLLLTACASPAAPEETAPTPSPSPDSQLSAPNSPLPSPSPTPPPFTWTPENFPRLDGSTATIPLGQAVAAAFLGLTREEAEPYAGFSGTDPAYDKLAGGDADLLIVYEAAPETLARYAGQFELAPIGRDALVFLVNKQNPVNNVDAAQLVKIYSADNITNWGEVGGEDAEIRAYQRSTPSGSQTMMQKLVMGEQPLAPAPSNLVIGEMGGLVDMIASYDNGKNAIGYNVYYYVTQMKRDENIKLLSIDGAAPSPETIGSGEYPFVNDFYAVIRKDALENSPARLVFNWLQTADAKKLMAREGYVPIAAPDAPPEVAVTRDGGVIPHVTRLNAWNGATVDREATLPAVMNGLAVPALPLGGTITVTFSENPPDRVTLTDALINADGSVRYKSTRGVPAEIAGGQIVFPFEFHLASAYSSNTEEVFTRGFVLTAEWDGAPSVNSCDYGFAIQQEKLAPAPVSQSAVFSQNPNS